MIEANFYIRSGEIANKQVVAASFRQLKDGDYHLEIKPKNIRSNNQNAYWWGVVVPLVFNGLLDAGFSEVKSFNDAHEVLKALFLKKHIVNEKTGEALEMDGSTATLTTIEFNLLIEKVQQWAAEYLSIEIPSPNEQIELW